MVLCDGNLHPTPLCDEQQLWWLGFLLVLYHRLLWLWFQGRLFALLRGLNPDSPRAITAFLAISRFVPGSLPVGRQK